MTDELGLQQHAVHISFQTKRVIMDKHIKKMMSIAMFFCIKEVD